MITKIKNFKLNRKHIVVLVIIAIVLFVMGLFPAKEAVFEDTNGNYTQITAVDGVVFDVPASIPEASTVLTTLDKDGTYRADDFYIWKDYGKAYYAFNLSNSKGFVLSVEKGTAFNMDSANVWSAIGNDSVNDIWFEQESKEAKAVSAEMNNSNKTIVTVSGQVSITPTLYNDFVGKLAVISYEGEEWALFVGAPGNSYEELEQNQKTVIEHIAASLCVQDGYEPDVVFEESAPETIEETISSQDESEDVTLAYSIENPAGVGDAGICGCMDENGNLLPCGVQLTQILTGEDAKAIIRRYTESDDAIYEYADAPEGCEWVVAEFYASVDAEDYYIDSVLTGMDGNRLKVHGVSYTKRTHDIRNFCEKKDDRIGPYYVYYALPNGCTEYLLILGDQNAPLKMPYRIGN